MPPRAKRVEAVTAPPAPVQYTIRELDPREHCIQKEADGGKWGITLPSICIIGKSYTGKTKVALQLLYELRDAFAFAIIISGSDPCNGKGDFSAHFPNAYIHSKMTAELLRWIVKHQEDLRAERANDPDYDPQVIVIFDDCIDKTNKQMVEFANLYKLGRHKGILPLVITQYFKELPVVVRLNTGLAFNAIEMDEDVLLGMWKQWYTCIRSREQYMRMFEKYTANYMMIVANTRTSTRDVTKRVFFYKAKPADYNSNWKFGSAKYWYMAAAFDLMNTPAPAMPPAGSALITNPSVSVVKAVSSSFVSAKPLIKSRSMDNQIEGEGAADVFQRSVQLQHNINDDNYNDHAAHEPMENPIIVPMIAAANIAYYSSNPDVAGAAIAQAAAQSQAQVQFQAQAQPQVQAQAQAQAQAQYASKSGRPVIRLDVSRYDANYQVPVANQEAVVQFQEFLSEDRYGNLIVDL